MVCKAMSTAYCQKRLSMKDERPPIGIGRALQIHNVTSINNDACRE